MVKNEDVEPLLPLNDNERIVMYCFWRNRKPLTVMDIVCELEAYALSKTVAFTVIKQLEEKGYLEIVNVSRTQRYARMFSPRVSAIRYHSYFFSEAYQNEIPDQDLISFLEACLPHEKEKQRFLSKLAEWRSNWGE